jgi:phage terminase Nu1 subunit (DNA packaging protein)
VKIVTKTAFAKLRGVTNKTVSIWDRKGLLVLAEDGRVCVEESNAALEARPPKYRGGVANHASDEPAHVTKIVEEVIGIKPEHLIEGAGWSTAEAVRRKEIALALTRQLEYDVASGKLVDAADVESIMRSDYASTAARLLGLPAKLAPRVINMKTPEEAQALMHSEFIKALNSLSKVAADKLQRIDEPVH